MGEILTINPPPSPSPSGISFIRPEAARADNPEGFTSYISGASLLDPAAVGSRI